MALPNGTSTEYTYDLLGRLTQLMNLAEGNDLIDAYSYRFNNKGLRSRVTYSDGRYTDYSYDKLYRLTQELQKKPDGTTIYRYDYTVDKVGNRTQLKYDNDAGKVLYYFYNDFNQLTSFFGTGGNKVNVTGTVGDATSGVESVVVTNTTNQASVTAEVRGDFYIARGLTLSSGGNSLDAEATDRAGNTTTIEDHSVTLDSSFSNSYSYDANGNLTSRTSEGQTTNYYYTYQDQLEYVDYPSGYDVKYSYDALGRKYMAQYGTYSGGSLTNVQTNLTRKYVYAGRVVIGELDNSNNLVREYVRGLSLGGGIGGILYCKQSGSFYYYHYDGSGNVTSVTDGDGEEVAIYEYDSFGNVLTEAGSLANEFRFSTKQADKRGQLIDFGFRWYDPEIGRWTQRDPLGAAGGFNLYGYCAGDPVNFSDPWGLRTAPIMVISPLVYLNASDPFDPNWNLDGITHLGDASRLIHGFDPRDLFGGSNRDEEKPDEPGSGPLGDEDADTSMGTPWEEFWRGAARGLAGEIASLPLVPDDWVDSGYALVFPGDSAIGTPEFKTGKICGTVAQVSLSLAAGHSSGYVGGGREIVYRSGGRKVLRISPFGHWTARHGPGRWWARFPHYHRPDSWKYHRPLQTFFKRILGG